MPVQFKASVMKVGNGLLITLPKPVCDGHGIKKGDFLMMYVTDDEIIIPFAEKSSYIEDPAIKRLK